MTDSIWIIGAGTAGTSAAIWARKENRSVEINIVGEEKLTEYSRCGLPYSISGEIPNFEDLVLHPEMWYRKFVKANLYLRHKVKKIDTKNKKLIIENLDSGETFEKEYGKLIIATGSKVKYPPIKGIDNPKVFKLKTIKDGQAIKDAVKEKKNVVIIGAGLIGLELAEALISLGANVEIVEFFPQVLPAMIDADMAKIVAKSAEKEGVKLYLNSMVTEIKDDGNVLKILAKRRDSDEPFELNADFVVAATGMQPNVDLARDAGIEIGALGGIKVDERMRTNIENVFAAGDCIETINLITRKPFLSGLGTLAARQGRVAGINAAGGDAVFPAALANRVTKLFGLEVAATGLTSQAAEKEGIEVVSARIKELDKEKYYPDKKEVVVKLIADKNTKKLIGGQVIGRGAALRSDIITSIIYHSGMPEDLINLETCYAPPVAPVWDPIAIAAMTLVDRLKRR
ncbi:MAG: FAD-dependent oxidoreductase [Candidatus Asgardarchaeia archaeon]